MVSSLKQVPTADRQFNDLPTKFSSTDNKLESDLTSVTARNPASDMFDLVRKSEIGRDQKFSGPFGIRQVTYCDYTATGRSLEFIEDFIRDEVLTEYGNTHTTSTITSLQTTLFRNEAKDIIRNSVNAGEHDNLLFVGSGCTAAVHKLVSCLYLTEPPVVFISPYEHHSNLLPWREALSEMVYIDEGPDGHIDLAHLEQKLREYSTSVEFKGRNRIGCFTAASNVTGTLIDTDSITILLHKYGALSFWDYATAAPHVTINMNPFVDCDDRELAYKDAIFFSVHKFIGGPQTPGILVAKKSLFKNKVPFMGGGGGTVFYVTKKNHRYLQNDEMREESGTPAIVESIRAGLVFQFKNAMGIENIISREREITKQAFDFFRQLPNLKILGNQSSERISIFSFLIRHEQTGLYLHSNFVSSLLNDLFGIQSRSGCMCAGPYAQFLLGINYELAKAYEEVLIQDSRLDRDHLRIKHDTTKAEILRPGFTRLNISFYLLPAKVHFILEAIRFVCEHGWKFLPLYIFNLETGEWRHRNHQVFRDRKWLGNVSYATNQFSFVKKTHCEKELEQCPITEEEYMKAAYKALESTKSSFPVSDQRLIFSTETAHLRWFLLSSEAYGIIHSDKSLYNNEFYTPLLKPKEYKPVISEADSNQATTNNSQAFEIGSTRFSDFVQEYEQSIGWDHTAKLVRQQVIKQLDSSPDSVSCPLYPVTAHKKKNSIKVDEESKEEKAKMTDGKSNEMVCKRKSPEPTKKFKHEWHHPQKAIFKHFIEAVEDFSMIRNGDKILVCLSGGKDSLSLLHTIRQYQFVCRSKNIYFDFGAVTVDPKTSAYNPAALKPYLAELGVPYFYEEQCIIDSAASIDPASICSFCSRMKRGRIYSTARKNGYNVLALGQHLDDFAESFMMSLFYNGKLWCMKAQYNNEEQDLRVIRPLVYVREKELRSFAESSCLPVIAENCPACFEAPKERQRIKQLLAQQELNFPSLFGSMLAAIRPIISINKCQISVKSLTEYALKMIDAKPDLYKELSNSQKESSSHDVEDSL